MGEAQQGKEIEIEIEDATVTVTDTGMNHCSLAFFVSSVRMFSIFSVYHYPLAACFTI